MFSLVNLKHIQKLEILYEFDVSFHTKVQSPVLLIVTQTKLSGIYRHKPIVTYCTLMKRHALLAI